MKAYGLLGWAAGAVIFCCGSSSAELLGSPDPLVRPNFNRLITSGGCPGCNLSGAVLNRLDLKGANLEGANLTGAQLNLSNLTGANLRKAVLRGAALGGASLAQADLREADLTGAALSGADFTDAQLDAATGTPREVNQPDLFGLNSPLPAAAAADSPSQPTAFDPFAVIATQPPSTGTVRQIDSIPVIEQKQNAAAAGFWDSFNTFLGRGAAGGQGSTASEAKTSIEQDGTQHAAEQNKNSQPQVRADKLINDICCVLPTQCQTGRLALTGRKTQ
jgi:hypothetical protein